MSTIDYTVTISGGYFIIKDSSGTVIAQNPDFGALMSTLNTTIPEGKMVLISSGLFPLVTVLNWTRNNTVLLLDASTIIRESATLSSTLFTVYMGGSQTAPNNITIDGGGGGILDGNNNPSMSPAWLIGGKYNVIQNLKAINTYSYGLNFWRAHDSKFLHITQQKASYGLSTGADPSGSTTAEILANMNTNIEMAYNRTKDNRDVGIKLRGINEALVHDNDVDCGYITWTTNQSGGTASSGIRFYSADAPNINVIVDHNKIYDSQRTRDTYGVFVDADQTAGLWYPTGIKSSGQIITRNTIIDIYKGIINKFTGGVVRIGTDASGAPLGNVIRTTARGLFSAPAAIHIWSGVTGTIVKFNDLRNNTTPLIDEGSGTILQGNLYSATGTNRRKITTSSTPINSPLTVQGFELGVSEIFYTEQGGTLYVGAKAISGYNIASFRINGIDYAPGANGLYNLTVGAQDYTIVAIYTPIPSHILVVTTTPLIGIPISLQGENYITPTPPLTLPEGIYSVSCPSNVIVDSDTWNFSQWEDGSINPQRTFLLAADATIMAIYVLLQPPPPAKGNIEVHSFLNQQEMVTNGVVVETGETFVTPSTLQENPGNYVIRVTLSGVTKELIATVTSGQTIRLDFQFQSAPIPPQASWMPLAIGTGLISILS